MKKKRNQYGSLFSKRQKECRKNWTEKKDIIKKVKIKNFDLDMQMDTSSEAALIPKNFWEHIGKPISWKNNLLFCQFDGSVIKTSRYFEGSLELEDKFEVIPIIVTTCKKNHRLLAAPKIPWALSACP